ncbi:sigma-70 family RNA polymerase sigma factor [Fictibacillus nanhaiensis]|nr:sigma-70 family RNA polymerase sigma factor [Fictibacillus nanhaiensis]MBY6038037.1 sigma-70 family RNA polymerase sigma factor [Fictibacillus nanhaiensis]
MQYPKSEMDQLSDLMDEYGEEIKRLAFTYTKNWQQAEDITQEIFISVYNNLNDFREQSTIKTWIYRIAINKCKDYVRSWHYTSTLLTNTFYQKSDDLSPEEEYLQNEQKEQISQLILQLPIKFREVIILYYFKEFSLEEISATLEINLNTVKSRLRRAKKNMETKMDRKGGV